MMIRARRFARGNSAVSAHSGIGMHDACRMLFRYKRKTMAYFCTTLALAVLCGIVYPRTNVSDAHFLVRLGTLPSSQMGERILTVPVRAFSNLARESAFMGACDPRFTTNS